MPMSIIRILGFIYLPKPHFIHIHMVVVRLLCMNLGLNPKLNDIMIVVYFVGVVNFVTMLYGRFWKLLQNKLRMKNSCPPVPQTKTHF